MHLSGNISLVRNVSSTLCAPFWRLDMSTYVFKLPDLGEGTVEAEIGEWHVKVGDVVTEDQIIVDMMTDKAAVEIPSPVGGRITALNGQAGDMVAVGSELIVFDTDADAAPAKIAPAEDKQAEVPAPVVAGAVAPAPAVERDAGEKALTSPAIRRRAREAGIDLSVVPGSGAKGRISREDFEAFAAGHERPTTLAPASRRQATGIEEIKVIGIRRVIAKRMAEAKRNIPHFSYVEEVDVTELEALRKHLNARKDSDKPNLTYLPFLALALARVLKNFPQCNALYDEERGVIVRHEAVHVGVATQTPDGLKVPVVKHVEALSLWGTASEMRRVSEAAKEGTASKAELTGSTITITSLGKLGGIASTPIINAPELGIIGVNKAVERPVVLNGAITVRRIMNLSTSFDHRFVDGYDAAAMVQELKDMLEHPASIFVDEN
jgi:2-oxoisovalerate dehydrogenase E2 component (dihydrolipoyl transacylase)